uniref:Uncharacterized protein n=1 Tax=Moniliophthora roreri TaxID=221103 RepID=A0A0W0FD45_MONRR
MSSPQPQSSLEEIAILVKEREVRYNYNSETQFAVVPLLDNADHHDEPFERDMNGRVAYIMLYTLRYLALEASNEDLKDIFGATLTKWGGRKGGVKERLQDEREWVNSRWNERCVQESVAKVRRELATLKICALSFDAYDRLLAKNREASVKEVRTQGVGEETESQGGRGGEEPESLEDASQDQCSAFHYRSAAYKDVIFVSPLLQVMEKAALGKANDDARKQQSIEALDVYVSKTVVHESINLIATLTHEDTYKTPLLVQGSFEVHTPTEEAIDGWGEAGEWFEVSRLGAFSSLHVVLPKPEDKHDTWRLSMTCLLDDKMVSYRELDKGTQRFAANQIRMRQFRFFLMGRPPLFNELTTSNLPNNLANVTQLRDFEKLLELLFGNLICFLRGKLWEVLEFSNARKTGVDGDLLRPQTFSLRDTSDPPGSVIPSFALDWEGFSMKADLTNFYP